MTTKDEIFPPGCREISGFGGGYEDTCRNMVVAGVNWCLANPEKAKQLSVKQYKNIYGICEVEGDAAKEFDDVLMDAAKHDCTGAMHQACVNHIFWIFAHSVKEYVEQMKKYQQEEENEASRSSNC